MVSNTFRALKVERDGVEKRDERRREYRREGAGSRVEQKEQVEEQA